MSVQALRQIEAVLSIPLVRETRPDGGLRITSPELPGLLLSAQDHLRVVSGLEPSIRWLLRDRLDGPITRVAIHADRADIAYQVAQPSSSTSIGKRRTEDCMRPATPSSARPTPVTSNGWRRTAGRWCSYRSISATMRRR